MSEAESAYPRSESGGERNLLGWLLIGGFVTLMVMSQLSAYFSRTPNSELLRAKVEEQLQTEIGLASKPSQATLESQASRLQTKLAGDATTTLLYAAIRTEQGKALTPGELAAIRYSKDPVFKGAYQIYSNSALTPDQAASIAHQIPQTSFLNRLVAAQAYEKAKNLAPREALSGAKSMAKPIAIGCMVLLTLLGAGLLFVYATARIAGQLQPKGFALGHLSAVDADRVALRCGQIMLAYLAVSLFAGQVLRQRVPKEYAQIPLYLLIVAAIFALSKVPVGGKLITLRSIGISKENLMRNAGWGIGAAIANIPILIVVQLATGPLFKSLPSAEHPVTVELASSSLSLMAIVQIALIASVFAPIIEETIFRGTLFPALAGVLKSPLWAGVISSIAFAAIHPTGIPAWPGLACIGGMSCFLAYQTKSLVPSMVMHCVHNFGTLIFSLLLLR